MKKTSTATQKDTRFKRPHDLLRCRCGASTEEADKDIRFNRYHDFLIPHWKTCRKGKDVMILDCFEWESF